MDILEDRSKHPHVRQMMSSIRRKQSSFGS